MKVFPATFGNAVSESPNSVVQPNLNWHKLLPGAYPNCLDTENPPPPFPLGDSLSELVWIPRHQPLFRYGDPSVQINSGLMWLNVRSYTSVFEAIYMGLHVILQKLLLLNKRWKKGKNAQNVIIDMIAQISVHSVLFWWDNYSLNKQIRKKL